MPARIRWMERPKRLASMAWDEVRGRLNQELAKRADFILTRMGVPFVHKESVPWPQGYGRFFFCPEQVSELVDWFRARKPEIVEETVKRAERICLHQFDLLGYEGLDYGAEIDWHLDAVHNKRAPRI